MVAAVGSVAALGVWTPIAPALAAPNPGQPVNCDYGQSPAEVSAEVSAQVAANASVKAAFAKLAPAHHLVVVRAAAEAKAKAAYLKAKKTHRASTIKAAAAKYAAAHKATLAAKTAEAKVKASYAATLAAVRKSVTAAHYLPVDGTYASTPQQYFIPGTGLEPITVNITVYGGHVSDVWASDYTTTGDSGSINADALPQLAQMAMAAHDTANISSVSGATVTSEAYRNGLVSALLKAGYKVA